MRFFFLKKMVCVSPVRLRERRGSAWRLREKNRKISSSNWRPSWTTWSTSPIRKEATTRCRSLSSWRGRRWECANAPIPATGTAFNPYLINRCRAQVVWSNLDPSPYQVFCIWEELLLGCECSVVFWSFLLYHIKKHLKPQKTCQHLFHSLQHHYN